MWLTSLAALVLALASALVLWRAATSWLAARRASDSLRRLLLRRAAATSEAARVQAGRVPVADAVDLGATVTRLGHETVAGLSFAILDAIPATRGRSRRIRERHDRFAARLYDAIDSTTESRKPRPDDA
jgi:hypothetical protein